MSSQQRARDPPQGQPDPKRPRTDAAATAPSSVPKPGAPLDLAAIRAQIAAKKAQVEASLAARSNGTPSSYNAPPPKPAPTPSAPGPAALPPPAKMDASIAERIAAAKARIEAMSARNANPYLSGTGSMPKPQSTPTPAPAPSHSSIALHPLLMGNASAESTQDKNEKRRERDRYKTMAPKFSTVKANQVVSTPSAPSKPLVVTAVVTNPYAPNPTASTSTGGANAGGEEERVVAPRRSRKMTFAPAGKFVKQGDVLRNEQKMEALRQRIAEASKKAGLDSEFDTLEKSLKRQPPPEVEWWDKAILPDGANYDDIESTMQYITSSAEPPITHLVQHPIPIAAPSDKKQTTRDLMLTKKEQKKMRRQRRQAELEDKRDRQKMGLIPPDAPKVRLANLMKVLTSDAVQDPTKVEAKVRKEVAMRALKHERDNKERKLTGEERKTKEYENMVARESKGIYGAAFKIKYLSNGRHRYKVRETAKKDLLSGVCIFHPSFALVLVEGTDKGIKHYTNLMLRRIDWTEQARPLDKDKAGSDAEGEGEGETAEGEGGGRVNVKAQEDEGPDSLEDNVCEMIWSGEVSERVFKQFRARHAESDTKAKEWLTVRYEGYWDLAKKYQWKGEDL